MNAPIGLFFFPASFLKFSINLVMPPISIMNHFARQQAFWAMVKKRVENP